MPTSIPAVNRVEEAVASALASAGRSVLAVSGGRDSMVLLDAAARLPLGQGRLVVASFDHGTGAAASAAVELAAEEAALRGLPCVIGRASTVERTEAGWRNARWEFLREVAHTEGARITTAHTRDDQAETVIIRLLRETGARGLAGLYARSSVIRPLLHVSRRTIADYARARGVVYVEDPTNLSRRYLRNRVRLDLLPALSRARPSFEADMLAAAERAADWRLSLERIVDGFDLMFLDARTIRIAAATLQGYDAASLRILWPEVAARVGVTMDRRGTERAAAFTIDRIAASERRSGPDGSTPADGRGGRGERGRVIQLSGGAVIEYVSGGFVLRRR